MTPHSQSLARSFVRTWPTCGDGHSHDFMSSLGFSVQLKLRTSRKYLLLFGRPSATVTAAKQEHRLVPPHLWSFLTQLV